MVDDKKTLVANITPFGLRMQPDLKARVEEAAKANNRSLNAEIVDRLESSFGDIEGYKELSEIFLETMKDNTARAKREVEEYRQMVTTIRLMRYIIERLKAHIGEDVPDDTKIFLKILSPMSEALEDDPKSLMLELFEAAERHDKIM